MPFLTAKQPSRSMYLPFSTAKQPSRSILCRFRQQNSHLEAFYAVFDSKTAFYNHLVPFLTSKQPSRSILCRVFDSKTAF